MKISPKFLKSNRNKKVFVDHSIYTIYKPDFLYKSIYLRSMDVKSVVLNGNESTFKGNVDRYNKFYEFYAVMSLVLTEMQAKDECKDNGEITWPEFTYDYMKLRELYLMSLDECLKGIAQAFPWHKFDASYGILTKMNSTFQDYFTAKPGGVGHGKVNNNIYEIEPNCFPCGLKETVWEALSIAKKELHSNLKHRNQQLIKGSIANYRRVIHEIKVGSQIVNEEGYEAHFVGFSLYFNHQKLVSNKYEIKILINKFFAFLKKKIGSDVKIFYAKNINFNTLVGIQLDLFLVSNTDVNALGSLVTQSWRQCCLDINKTSTIAYECVLSISGTLVSYDTYVYLQCIKSAFIRLNLPSVRSFSIGKIHEQ